MPSSVLAVAVSRGDQALQGLLKNSDDEDDRNSLRQALRKIVEVVTLVNERTRQVENVHALMEMESRFANPKVLNTVPHTFLFARNGRSSNYPRA